MSTSCGRTRKIAGIAAALVATCGLVAVLPVRSGKALAGITP
jgi:hypothetical protein